MQTKKFNDGLKVFSTTVHNNEEIGLGRLDLNTKKSFLVILEFLIKRGAKGENR